jgi:hypothetical protein
MSSYTIQKAKPGWNYKRVGKIVSGDPSLKRFIGEKTVSIERRNGTTVNYSPELILLMEAMAQAGIPLQTCPKTTVLQFAARFWIKESFKSVSVPVVAAPAQPSKPAPASLKAAIPRKEEVQNKVLKSDEKPTFCAAVALANLSMSMLQLAEHYDTSPGADKRREKLNALATEYEHLTTSYLDGCWEAGIRHNAKA